MNFWHIIFWCAAAVAAVAAVSFAVTYALLRVTTARADAPDLSDERTLLSRRWAPYAEQVKESLCWMAEQEWEEVAARGEDGVPLHGYWREAERAAGAVILFHGYHSCPENDFAGLMEYYAARGFHILAVEQRCHGESGGARITFGAMERFDALAWAALAAAKAPGLKIYLHGVSMGAATVLMASGLPLPEAVSGIIADCGFTTPKAILAYQLTRQYHLPQFPFVPVGTVAGMALLGRGFVTASSLRAVRGTGLPVLVVHGQEDHSVPVEMARQIYEACGGEKSLLLVRGAKHAVSFLCDSGAYSAALDAFFARE